METRVTTPETHLDHVRADLAEIKSLLKILPTIATKSDIGA
jgi:hypothetical protein